MIRNMKKLYAAFFVIFTVNFAVANPVINAVPVNGNWKISNTWSLNRLPQNGDTVVIPAGKLVTIDNIQNYSTDFLYIKVYGTLKLDHGKLWLNSNSSVIIFSGGKIISSGSPSETIKIGGVVKYRGNEGTLDGPMFANSSTGVSPNGFTSAGSIPLPVKFIGFNVARQNNNVIIEWATAQEVNSSYFEIQKSENGNAWTTIATITAAGNSGIAKNYSYTDRNVTGKIVFYRIRQVDIDGKFTITPIRVVKFEENAAEIKINAAGNNSICVHFSEQVKSQVTVMVSNLNGQVVFSKSISNAVGQFIFSVQNAMKGIYVVTVTNGQDIKTSKQVIL